MTKGLLINYEYCTGCHSCEVACKKQLNLGKGQFGIKIEELGPYAYDDKVGKEKWEWTFTPTITKACDMCEDRVAKGKMPSCVQHCQAWCILFGEVDELAKRIDGGSRFALFAK